MKYRQGRVLAASAFAVCELVSAQAFAHTLPLGDGKVSTSAKAGYVLSCQRRFNKNGGGAEASGDWLDERGKTWDPALKPIVDGSVKWPGKVSIKLQSNMRVISANGLPTHETGTFPVSRKDDAYAYDRNPNRISKYKVLLQLPANPQIAAEPTCVPMGMIGFAISGVAIFNALDALGRDAPAHEIQDKCDGHPERSGQYHYHDLSRCLNDTRSGPGGTSDLLGYALDGFGIYGSYENGRELTSKDLDECHGRTSKVMWNGKPQEIYHYVFTRDYPYTVGCFKGEVTVRSAAGGQQGGAGGSGGPRAGGGPLATVAAQLGVPFETLRKAAGGPPPNFARIARKLGMSEAKVRAAFQSARPR